MKTLNLFIRQPLTESHLREQSIIEEVLQLIAQYNGVFQHFNYLTGIHAESAETFKQAFEQDSGEVFTPQHFRRYRLVRLKQADAFINIRVGMSESSAFEISYHIYSGTRTPLLFLVWDQAPVKTTLLRDLEDICDITYLYFSHVEELKIGIEAFFRDKFTEEQ
ncbi:MAG: hypothetical protein V4525_13990 [Pseudomonadota bacterium]